MDGTAKVGRSLSGAVSALFGALMACILYATMFVDKGFRNPFPNTVPLANDVYYLAALAALGGLFLLIYARPGRRKHLRRGTGMTPRGYGCALLAMFAVVAVLQFFVSRWMPASGMKDLKNVLNGAEALARGDSLESFPYFKTSPNNLNITIILSWVYAVFRSTLAVTLVGALRTAASVALASLAVYNVTRRGEIALAVAVLGNLLVALNWRAFVVYSDNYGMIYSALMVWLCTARLKPWIKVPLITLFAAMGCFVKVTGCIVFAALAANGLINWMSDPGRGLKLRRMLLYAGCFALCFGAAAGIRAPLYRRCGYERGEYPKGWQYMLMVGQNTDTAGATGSANVDIRKAYIKQYGNLRDVNRAFLRTAWQSVKARGLKGNLTFYIRKLVLVYNDGYFHNVQTAGMRKLDRSFLYDVYIRSGKYYRAGATLFQVLWDMVLATMMLYAVFECRALLRRRDSRRAAAEAAPTDRRESFTRFLKIAILGITLYLMVLEGRSKYLYMFMPVYLAAFGVMFDGMGRAASAALARRGTAQARE